MCEIFPYVEPNMTGAILLVLFFPRSKHYAQCILCQHLSKHSSIPGEWEKKNTSNRKKRKAKFNNKIFHRYYFQYFPACLRINAVHSDIFIPCIWITHIRRRFKQHSQIERERKSMWRKQKSNTNTCMAVCHIRVYVCGSAYFRAVHPFDIIKCLHGPIPKSVPSIACSFSVGVCVFFFPCHVPYASFCLYCCFRLPPFLSIYLYTLEYEFLVIRMLWSV